MDRSHLSRRELFTEGSAAVAGLALLQTPLVARAFSTRPGEEVIPFLDQPPPEPAPGGRNQLKWEALNSWITPNEQFFRIAHYQRPNGPVLDAQAWRLNIGGLVKWPLSFTLDEIKSRPRREMTVTLECSGNHGFPWFTGGLGTAKWVGTPLAPILQEAGVLDAGIEIVFLEATAVNKKFAMSRSCKTSPAVSPSMTR